MVSILRRFALAVVACVVFTACAGGKSDAPDVVAGTKVAASMDLASDVFSFPNFGAKKSPEKFDSRDVVAMFGDGPEVCAGGSGNSCELAPEAATWARMVNQARQSGHCEGFAVMASARFAQKASPATATLANEGDVTHALMRGFATQFAQSVQKETTGWAKKSVAAKVAAIDEALAADSLEWVLGVYTDTGGHAVLPWKIEYLDGQTARIHVYDSNWPGADRYVTANLKENSWSFSFSGKDPANDPKMWTGGSSDMDIASMSARADGECPFCKGDARVKSSMFVIRAAALDWTVRTGEGTLSPTVPLVGDDSSRPMRAADGGATVSDYLINATVAEQGSVVFNLPSTTHITGLTGGGAIEAQTSGDSSVINVSNEAVSSPDPGTVLTLASGGFVATANGSNTEIRTTTEGLEVRTETPTGQAVNVVVNETAPAVEVRTAGTGAVQGGGYQIVTQTAANEITTKTVSEGGAVTVAVTTGRLAATGTEANIPEALAVPPVDPALPPAEERVLLPAPTTTTTSTTSTVPLTTTTTRPPTTTSSTATTSSSSTTSTTTTAPSTTTTVKPTTTTAAPTTTTTVAPSVPWLQHLSAVSNEQHQQIITDSAGNVYATGYFCGATMAVGSSTLVNNLSSPGREGVDCDGYLEKVSPGGAVVWAKRWGGTASDFPYSLAIDGSGSLYVGAQFASSFQFGSSTVSYTYGGGSAQAVYLKFDSVGTPQWAWAIPSTNVDAGWIRLAAQGNNVYLGLRAYAPGQSVSIGGVTGSIPNGSQDAVVVASLNPANGVPAWMRFVHSSAGAVQISDLAADSVGNVYAYGVFQGSTAVAGGTTLTHTMAGNNDAFLTRLTSAGAWSYAFSFGGTGSDDAYYVSVASTSRVLISYRSDSGSVTKGQTVIAPSAVGVKRFGVIDVNWDGQILTVSPAKNYSVSQSTGLSLGGFAVHAGSGIAYLAGAYNSGTINVGSSTLADPGASADVFYVAFRLSDGATVLSGQVGGNGDEFMQGGNGVTIDPWGNPFLAFDSWSSSLSSGGNSYQNQDIDAYLVKSNTNGDWP